MQARVKACFHKLTGTQTLLGTTRCLSVTGVESEWFMGECLEHRRAFSRSLRMQGPV